MNQATSKGYRLHIGIFGKRNVGKSSLLNAITRQSVSIVSEYAGTTTDPVEKSMELLPIGPVLFIDTAGLDDEGEIGLLRIEKTKKVFDRTDVAILVMEPHIWSTFEETLFKEFQKRKIPCLIAINKIDLTLPSSDLLNQIEDFQVQSKIPVKIIQLSTQTKIGIPELRHHLFDLAPDDVINQPCIASDLAGPGEMAILVTPIDKEAPKGRLILPQMQTLRDLLDGDAYCLVVKERELHYALKNLPRKPKIVITDSQCFLKVAADIEPDIPLTSFSILFSRFKGDLISQTEATQVINTLKTGDKILIAEACSHHPITEDIGRVKIPRWMTQYVGGKLSFTFIQGNEFPSDLSEYKMAILCGSCMLNRKAVLHRIYTCKEAGVPCSNYGLVIAHSLGILKRALTPFPAALDAYLKSEIRKL